MRQYHLPFLLLIQDGSELDLRDSTEGLLYHQEVLPACEGYNLEPALRARLLLRQRVRGWNLWGGLQQVLLGGHQNQDPKTGGDEG